MSKTNWRHIAGVEIQEAAKIAAVWIGHDKTADCVHVYDGHIFEREVFAVIVHGLQSRGKWIPIAWDKTAKDIADALTRQGCNMLVDSAKETPLLAEGLARDIWGRMRIGQFRVDRNLTDWLDEFERFRRLESGEVPREGYPLMAATRHAIGMLDWARKHPRMRAGQRKNYPEVAVL